MGIDEGVALKDKRILASALVANAPQIVQVACLSAFSLPIDSIFLWLPNSICFLYIIWFWFSLVPVLA